MSIKDSVLAKKCSKALCDNSTDNDILEFVSILNSFNEIIKNPDYKLKILDPFLSINIKKSIFKSGNKKLDRLLDYLCEIDGLSTLTNIYDNVKLEYDKRLNIYKGFIYSKDNISSNDMKLITKGLSNYIGKNIELKSIINDYDGVEVVIPSLFLEINFSMDFIKNSLINFVLKAV